LLCWPDKTNLKHHTRPPSKVIDRHFDKSPRIKDANKNQQPTKHFLFFFCLLERDSLTSCIALVFPAAAGQRQSCTVKHSNMAVLFAIIGELDQKNKKIKYLKE
jgi:hypothetical protein